MNFPRSMTAFGRGEATAGERTWTVEIRSVNHRYCDIKVRLPRAYTSLEEAAKREVGREYSRGHVEVTLSQRGGASDAALAVDLPLAREYLRGLNLLRDELSLADRPSLNMLKDLPGIFTTDEIRQDPEGDWPLIRQALVAALESTRIMRQQEGAATREELRQYLAGLHRHLERLQVELPTLIARRSDKLQQRLSKLLGDTDLEPIRLAQEIALLTDKADISEELARLDSHLNQFAAFLAANEPTGRRLDFLLQEFFREINTIASKISEAGVAQLSVEMKNEVEKMREQVQNLE
ncbi:YicC/YloC family endoribonuclease [Desulfurivibrio dismutans]|uniref:YicC/YloC family endoribonuclease n=1 Tax=Desulfurivibrio dismutans TaxID=1398908 RepID=UPI0023DAC757|nr:YicC/YloC family endoribonuclease [Desulfurivibrio alkaliphilus]MDF1614519.1 YicC family protein [Desulfurivibrio alkaliphilus]